MKNALLTLAVMASSACTQPMGDTLSPGRDFGRVAAPAADPARSGLQRAHRAFIAGDMRTMVRELSPVLQDPETDDAARANAIALLDRAFVEGGGRLDSGFELPVGMTRMRLLFQRAENDGVASHLAILQGGLEPGIDLSQLRLVRSRDGRVLASKGDGVGYYESGVETDHYFYIHSTEAPFAMESGAYRVEWEYADERSGSVVVLVPSVDVDGVAQLLEPRRGAVVHEHRPRVAWKAPSWVADKSFGQLGLFTAISSIDTVPWAQNWLFSELGAGRTDAEIGKIGVLRAELENGKSYNVAVSYFWKLQYGELEVGGQARASQTFSVSSAR